MIYILLSTAVLLSCAEKKEVQKIDYGEYERCMDAIAIYDRCANPGTSCGFHAKKVSIMLEDSELSPDQRAFIVRTCYRICSQREVYFKKVRPKLMRDCSKLLNPG